MTADSHSAPSLAQLSSHLPLASTIIYLGLLLDFRFWGTLSYGALKRGGGLVDKQQKGGTEKRFNDNIAFSSVYVRSMPRDCLPC